MNPRENGFIRPTMKSFFEKAGKCKDDLNLCSKSSVLKDKISISEYGFASKSKNYIPPNYFCVIDETNMDYPGLFINNTNNIANVFL